MPITVEWHNPEKTALRSTYAGVLHPDDALAGHLTRHELLESVSHPVILIFDYRGVTTLAIGILGRIKPVAQAVPHPNEAKLAIYVGLNQLLSTFAQIIFRLYPARFVNLDLRLVRTMEEADRIIQEYRANTSSASPLT